MVRKDFSTLLIHEGNRFDLFKVYGLPCALQKQQVDCFALVDSIGKKEIGIHSCDFY